MQNLAAVEEKSSLTPVPLTPVLKRSTKIEEATYKEKKISIFKYFLKDLKRVSGHKIALTTLNSSITSLEAKSIYTLDSEVSPLVILKSLQKHLDKDSFFDIYVMVSRTEEQVNTIAMAGTIEYAFHCKTTEKENHLVKTHRRIG